MDTLSSQHKQTVAECVAILDKAIGEQVSLSEASKEKFRLNLQSSIKEMYDQIKAKVKQEHDRQAKDVLAELYREHILPKQFTELGSFFKDWQELEKTYFSKVAS